MHYSSKQRKKYAEGGFRGNWGCSSHQELHGVHGPGYPYLNFKVWDHRPAELCEWGCPEKWGYNAPPSRSSESEPLPQWVRSGDHPAKEDYSQTLRCKGICFPGYGLEGDSLSLPSFLPHPLGMGVPISCLSHHHRLEPQSLCPFIGIQLGWNFASGWIM